MSQVKVEKVVDEDDYGFMLYEAENVVEKANSGYFIRRRNTKLKKTWRGIIKNYLKNVFTVKVTMPCYKDYLLYIFTVIKCLYYGQHHYAFSHTGSDPVEMIGVEYDKIVEFAVRSLIDEYGYEEMNEILIDKADSIDFENNRYGTYFGVYSHYGDLVKKILEEYK